MTQYLTVAADIIAILLLTLAVYFPRHRRRDLVTAFLAVNAGVLAVSVALSNSTASMGLALGLFGVLSIIRLRSSELAQHEVAYYFSALALGLLGGIAGAALPLVLALMALIVAVMAIGDHPGLLGVYRQQTIVLDRAIVDDHELRAYVEATVGAPVHGVSVQRTDLIHDSTVVDVRYRARSRVTSPAMDAQASHA